jgi:hypothetical protein
VSVLVLIVIVIVVVRRRNSHRKMPSAGAADKPKPRSTVMFNPAYAPSHTQGNSAAHGPLNAGGYMDIAGDDDQYNDVGMLATLVPHGEKKAALDVGTCVVNENDSGATDSEFRGFLDCGMYVADDAPPTSGETASTSRARAATLTLPLHNAALPLEPNPYETGLPPVVPPRHPVATQRTTQDHGEYSVVLGDQPIEVSTDRSYKKAKPFAPRSAVTTAAPSTDHDTDEETYQEVAQLARSQLPTHDDDEEYEGPLLFVNSNTFVNIPLCGTQSLHWCEWNPRSVLTVVVVFLVFLNRVLRSSLC